MSIHGPAIIEQSDTTTVIEPDMGLSVDNQGNLLVRMN
jgi:N-methylhydantoinase A/oxoprolinase/acetone carboxylase beta subunit